jgi:hypothetical protein
MQNIILFLVDEFHLMVKTKGFHSLEICKPYRSAGRLAGTVQGRLQTAADSGNLCEVVSGQWLVR